MPRLTQEQTRELFLAACRAELNALKPGNVHIHAGGHGMETAHFEASAVAAAPWIADRALNVGARIQRAVETSMTVAGVNTNLGILLLSAPLALAAEHTTGSDLRSEVALVLARLDDADTEAVFAAIRRANPGGLGSAPEQDVARAPTAGLLEAMALAADRDRIAAGLRHRFRGGVRFRAARASGARGRSPPRRPSRSRHSTWPILPKN